MPIALVYLVQQPVITESGNDSFVRIGDSSPANVPGFYVFVTEPVPTSSEIRHYILTSQQIRRFIFDGYRERKTKNRITHTRTIIDQRQKPVIPPTIEPVPVIKLGGEFLQIGGDNENAGGGHQKLG